MRKLFALLVLALPMTMMAQTAGMMAMARGELQKRGLQEAEVRTRLLENGIDVDNIPLAEYAAYQDRVVGILNQMQAEKAQAAQIVQDTTTTDDTLLTVEPQTTDGEAAAENALEEALVENNVNVNADDDIYGHALFTGKSLDVFRTTDGAQAPDTYVMGEGDEVHISIFGSSQTEIHQRIGADGAIQPAGASKIFLKGMTLEQARQAVISKLAASYSFREDQIAVTITTARTILVNIYGEVGVQGGFTLSALNSAFNALAAAGGPTSIGSVRNIQMSRGGKTSRLDLYKYMTAPDAKVKYDLQNGDVLFVPVADKIVTLEGAVSRPMRYEMIGSETLKDLVNYAGGLSYNVNPDYVQIERNENGEINYLEFNLEEAVNGSKGVELKNGDVVRIRRSNKPLENYVAIQGGVFYGGNYALKNNTSLQALIEKAQPKYTVMKDYVFVERTRPDETVEVLTVPYPGVDGNPDFELQARDVVRVQEQATYRDLATITVSGQVREPFSREFGLNDRMTVQQAIGYAGGLKPSVFPVAYIFRRNMNNPAKMEYLRIELDKDGETQLQPGDNLRVYDNSTYTNVGEVRISGAVKEPIATEYDQSLTVHDLIAMAGGFEVGAAYDRIEVFRVNIAEEEAGYEQFTLKVDDEYNIVGDDFQLQPYDNVVVRMTPNFSFGRTVEVNGRVKYPGVYVLKDDKTQLHEILELAGGLLDDADPFARLFRTYNNRGNIGLDLRQVKSNKGSLKADPILMDGDVINIVRQENTVFIRETGTRMSQYVPDEYASTQKIVIYQGNRNAAWYVRHYAGGFIKTADKNSVTVTFPNNQSESTKRGFLGIRNYPTVEPGGVITMRIDPDKVEKLEKKTKEKVDWDNMFSKTLSSLTSIVSIILLVDRL